MRPTSPDREVVRDPGRVVARDLPEGSVRDALPVTDLRTGSWTRLGSGGALGDGVTESVLGGIAEQARQAGRAQGYAAGWAEGRRAALAVARQHADAVRRETEAERARREDEHLSVLAALDSATDQARTRLAEAVDALADQAVEAALAIAEAVLGRELAVAADPGADALRRAMGLVDPAVTATVRLNPDDRAALDPAVLHGRDVLVVEDPLVARGDALVETDDSLVDATVVAALERVREVLAR